jgi:hypothetical protein
MAGDCSAELEGQKHKTEIMRGDRKAYEVVSQRPSYSASTRS